ncbi:hypothetical protein [Sinorhizobium fredii]|nr:hypothetical protein [Sinorhizobium fredii]ASY68902.1 hypothetical protein SF83666_c14810 [Sinorhizobium fredii CCBAU 83666]
MSMWQLAAALEGYAKANDPEAAKELSPAEADDLWDWMQKKG